MISSRNQIYSLDSLATLQYISPACQAVQKCPSAAFPSWFDKLTMTDFRACPEPVEGGALHLNVFEQPEEKRGLETFLGFRI